MERDTLHPFSVEQLHEETRKQLHSEINEQTGGNHVAQGGLFSGTDVALIFERASARALVRLTAGTVRCEDCERIVAQVTRASRATQESVGAALAVVGSRRHGDRKGSNGSKRTGR